jgi:hypothetical protein
MSAATQPAEINDHCNQQPKKIDSRRRHVAVQLPCVDDRSERQKNESDYQEQQATVEGARQVGRKEPHQHKDDARKKQDGQYEEARHGAVR